MTEYICTWSDDTARQVVHNKKAIGACMFISFIGYTIAALIGELRRGTKVFNQIYNINMNRSLRTCVAM